MLANKINKLKNKFGIPRNVFALGWVSFFNDFASEMVYPIVPIFLTTFLGVPVAIVGLIEGIAESTASIGSDAFCAVNCIVPPFVEVIP